MFVSGGSGSLMSVVVSYLSGLVLGDLVEGVLAALLALAVGLSGLWNVDLKMRVSLPAQYISRKHNLRLMFCSGWIVCCNRL